MEIIKTSAKAKNPYLVLCLCEFGILSISLCINVATFSYNAETLQDQHQPESQSRHEL